MSDNKNGQWHGVPRAEIQWYPTIISDRCVGCGLCATSCRVLAGTFAGALKQMQALGRWSNAIEKTSGIIVIAVGMYFLWIA